MTKINDGGPAFPVPIPKPSVTGSMSLYGANGMSLRDWFAGQVAGVIMANMMAQPVSMTSPTILDVAEKAYSLADAMLAERNKNNT